MMHCQHCGRRIETTVCPCWEERMSSLSRGEESLQPMDLTPGQATELQSNLDAGTARPKIAIKKIPMNTPSQDDPKCHELGTHFNLWTACGIVVVALIVCYFTESYPWINGVLKF